MVAEVSVAPPQAAQALGRGVVEASGPGAVLILHKLKETRETLEFSLFISTRDPIMILFFC